MNECESVAGVRGDSPDEWGSGGRSFSLRAPIGSRSAAVGLWCEPAVSTQRRLSEFQNTVTFHTHTHDLLIRSSTNSSVTCYVCSNDLED